MSPVTSITAFFLRITWLTGRLFCLCLPAMLPFTAVLHFLVDRLNRLYGRLEPVAFLYGCKGTNPAWATPLLPPWRNVSKGIAVYPEVTWGNDMNSGHVIRWVLWFPGGQWGPEFKHTRRWAA